MWAPYCACVSFPWPPLQNFLAGETYASAAAIPSAAVSSLAESSLDWRDTDATTGGLAGAHGSCTEKSTSEFPGTRSGWETVTFTVRGFETSVCSRGPEESERNRRQAAVSHVAERGGAPSQEVLGCRFLVDSDCAGKACKMEMEIKETRMTLQRVLPPGMQSADGKAGIGISFAPDSDGYQIIQSMAPQGTAAASGKVHETATRTVCVVCAKHGRPRPCMAPLRLALFAGAHATVLHARPARCEGLIQLYVLASSRSALAGGRPARGQQRGAW